MIRRVMFSLNRNKQDIYETVASCAVLCRRKNVEPVFFEEDVEQLRENLPELMEQPYCALRVPDPEQIDMIFVFGGDGTMLRALSTNVEYDIPMLGINLGRLGFLLETEVGELSQALDMLCAGEYEIERRLMLRVQMEQGGRTISAYATNEVSISRALSQRMIALDAYVGRTLVEHYIADGVVLASPTGSTGYSLSAGGPIVCPDVPCFVLNPICPHTLQSRPIVLSCREPVTLCVNMKEMREGIQLSIDGQAVCQMHNQERVVVTRSEHDGLLVRFPKERNFFSLLKEKLSQWSL